MISCSTSSNNCLVLISQLWGLFKHTGFVLIANETCLWIASVLLMNGISTLVLDKLNLTTQNVRIKVWVLHLFFPHSSFFKHCFKYNLWRFRPTFRITLLTLSLSVVSIRHRFVIVCVSRFDASWFSGGVNSFTTPKLPVSKRPVSEYLCLLFISV